MLEVLEDVGISQIRDQGRITIVITVATFAAACIALFVSRVLTLRRPRE